MKYSGIIALALSLLLQTLPASVLGGETHQGVVLEKVLKTAGFEFMNTERRGNCESVQTYYNASTRRAVIFYQGASPCTPKNLVMMQDVKADDLRAIFVSVGFRCEKPRSNQTICRHPAFPVVDRAVPVAVQFYTKGIVLRSLDFDWLR